MNSDKRFPSQDEPLLCGFALELGLGLRFALELGLALRFTLGLGFRLGFTCVLYKAAPLGIYRVISNP